MTCVLRRYGPFPSKHRLTDSCRDRTKLGGLRGGFFLAVAFVMFEGRAPVRAVSCQKTGLVSAMLRPSSHQGQYWAGHVMADDGRRRWTLSASGSRSRTSAPRASCFPACQLAQVLLGRFHLQGAYTMLHVHSIHPLVGAVTSKWGGWWQLTFCVFHSSAPPTEKVFGGECPACTLYVLTMCACCGARREAPSHWSRIVCEEGVGKSSSTNRRAILGKGTDESPVRASGADRR
jgi:hypothetical protein